MYLSSGIDRNIATTHRKSGNCAVTAPSKSKELVDQQRARIHEGSIDAKHTVMVTCMIQNKCDSASAFAHR